MNITVKENFKPKLIMPKFNVDEPLDKKLDDYEIMKLMNKSNITLFLGKPGSGKTSLMTSFLKTKELFYKVYYRIYLFMPSNSRASMKDSFFDKNLPEEQIFPDLMYEDLNDVFLEIGENSTKKKKSLIIFDDVQDFFEDKIIQKLLKKLVNNRRHLRLSLWFCVQNYKQIPKRARSGLTDLFVFEASKEEMEDIFKEQVKIYKEDFIKIMNITYNEPHNFLYINSETKRLFKNWDELIIDSK